MKGFWSGRMAVAMLGTVAWVSAGGCGSDSESGKKKQPSELNACDACANTKCASESDACNDLAGCRAIRECQYSCASSDTVCRANCVAARASDSNAAVAAGLLVACATVSCLQECNAVSTPVVPGAAGNTSVVPGGGGASSGGKSCQDLQAWGTNCGFDSGQTQAIVQACAASSCAQTCMSNATCVDFFEIQSNQVNGLAQCLANCTGVSLGTGGAPSTPNPTPTTPIPPTTPTPDPTVPTSASFVVGDGGYITTPTWHGYAWSATDNGSGSTIAPTVFETFVAGSDLCVSGTVAGTSDYSAVAMLGFSLSQAKAAEGASAPDPVPVTPSNLLSGGIHYGVLNRGGTPLRVQIQGPNGATDPTDRWCADLFGSTGDISWREFDTECWEGGAGVLYEGEPLESVMVLVPGSLSAQSFDFCIYELSEG